MSEINIPFNKWSKERLKAKVKLATTRTKRYGKEGDTFVVHLGQVDYKFELLAVFQLSLYDVASKLYYIEGAESPLAFRKVWEQIHPRSAWEPDKKVYVHLFRLIEVV